MQALLWDHHIPTGNGPEEEDVDVKKGPHVDVLRTKGILFPDDQPAGTKIVIQGVQELYDVKETAPSTGSKEEEKTPENRVVLIGRGLDKKLLVASCARYLNMDPTLIHVK